MSRHRRTGQVRPFAREAAWKQVIWQTIEEYLLGRRTTPTRGIPLYTDPDKGSSRLYEGIEYSDFWAGNSKSKLDGEEHAVVGRFLIGGGHRLIDIGCGYGRLADCYLDRFEQVVMLDGSMTLLRQAQEMVKGKAFYIAADANHLPFCRASFDCALMIRVFHHLPDSEAILLELRRILRSRGALVFNYSNKRNALQLVRWCLRLSKENPFTGDPVGVGTTFVRHHPASIHRLLLKTGFFSIEYRGVGVMDKVSGVSARYDKWVPSGEEMAPLLGYTKLAPWIVCKAVAGGESATPSDKSMEDIIVCPLCNNGLRRSSQAYICLACEKSFPIEDGIADFRTD